MKLIQSRYYLNNKINRPTIEFIFDDGYVLKSILYWFDNGRVFKNFMEYGNLQDIDVEDEKEEEAPLITTYE